MLFLIASLTFSSKGEGLLVILKLGGSVISDKRVPYSLNVRYLRELGGVLRDALGKGIGIVLIHGGGSFGHPKVKELMENGKDLRGHGWEVVNVMGSMTLKVVEALGEPFAAYSTTSLWVNDGIVIEPIVDALESGWVPVLQGNVVPQGRVVSGDEIVVELVRKLRAERALLATDVPGIYPSWPPRGEPLKAVRACEVEAGGSEGIDVTGGMRKKLEELNKVPKGVEVRVFDGKETENVRKALRGEPLGTLVLPC